jgi:hypothetical protein
MRSESSPPEQRSAPRRRDAGRTIFGSGLVFAIVLVAAASTGGSDSAAFDARAGYVSEAPALVGPPTEHRRQVFEERRARFEHARSARASRSAARNAG